MLKNYLLGAVVVSVMGLSGCASNANVGQMTYAPQTFKTPKRLSLLTNIDVKNVEGGQETQALGVSKISNNNFKAALVQSLQSAHLYKTLRKAQYNLTADVMNLDQPYVGLDMTVKFKVHYRLEDVKKKVYIYDKDVISSYTAKLNDSLSGVERLRMANEGAARENIKKFIQDLYRLPRVS